MSVRVVRMSAKAFRTFREQNCVDRCDEAQKVAWLANVGGKVRCLDAASLWNAGAGGVDDVVMVIADSEEEALAELARHRRTALR